jgi:uncharacterized protein (DUF2336 family)
MPAPASLIPELEEVVQRGSLERRVRAIRRITEFFLAGAGRFNDEHIELFDLVLTRLIVEIGTRARTELSHRLAPLGNAPVEVVRRLAHDDDIAVAGPILKQSWRLTETDLIDIAATRGQAHLLAIAGRARIAEPVTDVLIRRGQREVAHRVAENRGARLSDASFVALVGRAERDGMLAEKVGLRPDTPRPLFRHLLLKATAVVQQRLLASAKPGMQSEIRHMLADVSSEIGAPAAPHDYSAAQRAIEAMRRDDKLSEASLRAFAETGHYEETIAALASLCAVPVEVVDRLMGAERCDPILILGKSTGWNWPTVKAIIMLRPDRQALSIQTSSPDLETAQANFDRLSPTTAQRVLRFWQVRADDGPQTTDDGSWKT